jgi:hypothetical protein
VTELWRSKALIIMGEVKLKDDLLARNTLKNYTLPFQQQTMLYSLAEMTT